MFYFERGKHSCRIITQLFVSISGKLLPIVTKCFVLDVAGVIKPLKKIFFKCLARDNNWSL